MKIGVCMAGSITGPFRGGSKWVVNVTNSLVDRGHDVTIHGLPYADESNEYALDSLPESVEYIEQWVHYVSEYDVVYSLYTPVSTLFFRNMGPSVAGIHAWNYVCDEYIQPHHGALSNGLSLVHEVGGDRILNTYDAVHSISSAISVDHPAVYAIPNFIDLNEYEPDTAQDRARFTVLVTSPHIERKGWDLVVETARRLPDSIDVYTTGDSEHDSITGLGFLSEEELTRWYAKSHVLLYPSREDVDSLAIKEAYASGTPVVTTPIPTHELMFDGETDEMCFGETAEGLTDQLLSLHAEWENEQERFSNRCRAVRERAQLCGRERVMDKLEDMLWRVTSGRATTASDVSLH